MYQQLQCILISNQKYKLNSKKRNQFLKSYAYRKKKKKKTFYEKYNVKYKNNEYHTQIYNFKTNQKKKNNNINKN